MAAKPYKFRPTRRFWKSFSGLTQNQKAVVRRKFAIFKQDPFDTRLGTHRIHSLSAIFRRTVYAVVIEGDLRATFHIDGDTVISTNIGTHDIYRS